MNLRHLNDRELLTLTKELTQKERHLLTEILQHLCEVERRKLFCDLGYQSLFEYAVKELKYSEGQAGRRIQAMRLIKELPELENKIASGSLSLSNISQAQSYFREARKNIHDSVVKSGEVTTTDNLKSSDKLKILESLENKSAREGQKILMALSPEVHLPNERERVLSNSQTEIRIVLTEEVMSKLEELRSLLGAAGAAMRVADLIDYMAGVSIEALKDKKFGKNRGKSNVAMNYQEEDQADWEMAESAGTPTPEAQRCKKLTVIAQNPEPQVTREGRATRYIPKIIQHQMWQRDQGKCCNCQSQRNLNIDHIQPLALGGSSEVQNLRLLCFSCNQRAAIKIFGVEAVGKWEQK